MALTAESRNPDAEALLDFLVSPAARPFFEAQGFAVLAMSSGRGPPPRC